MFRKQLNGVYIQTSNLRFGFIFLSKTKVKIPLLGNAEELINKYKEHPMTIISGTIFPKITNEKLNAYLKDVAFVCGLKKEPHRHMARHTFATTVTLSNGVPIETVSK